MVAVRSVIFGNRVDQKVDVVLEVFLEECGGVIVLLAIETDIRFAERLCFLFGFDFVKPHTTLKSRASFKCIMHVASLGGRNSVSTHTV